MPFADANGQRLFYLERGEGEPLLLVTGLGGDHLSWGEQIAPFSERYRAIMFDNRDSGQSSEAPEAYEIVDMAHDALGLTDALGLEGFHLIGISMGGAIAQEAALAAPERVRTLTLAVTFARAGAWARKLSELWGARRQRQSREEHVDELLLLNLSEEFFENGAGLDYVRGMMLAEPHPQPPEAFARQLDASSRHDARERLGSLPMPVHVIGAERDILVPVWKSRELAELIPRARLTVIERSPHGATLERAEEFNRAVLDFIWEHSAATARR